MQKQEFARKRAGEVNLPELLDQLELALAGTPARKSVCRALSDLKRGSVRLAGKPLHGRVNGFRDDLTVARRDDQRAW
jgi:hypothetical protein